MTGLSLTILNVNVGRPAPLGMWQGENITSGIRKAPVQEAMVELRTTNLDGDEQADLHFHGGADKAVYAYPAAHADWWMARGVDYRAGFMGENLTLDGADEAQVRIGDVFAWGAAVLQISEPRGPCFKLGLLTGREDAPAQMTLSGFCGWYFRVMQPARVPVAGALVRIKSDAEAPTVRETFLAKTRREIRAPRVLEIAAYPALAASWRESLLRAWEHRE